jgi:hypothetical protein
MSRTAGFIGISLAVQVLGCIRTLRILIGSPAGPVTALAAPTNAVPTNQVPVNRKGPQPRSQQLIGGKGDQQWRP